MGDFIDGVFDEEEERRCNTSDGRGMMTGYQKLCEVMIHETNPGLVRVSKYVLHLCVLFDSMRHFSDAANRCLSAAHDYQQGSERGHCDARSHRRQISLEELSTKHQLRGCFELATECLEAVVALLDLREHWSPVDFDRLELSHLYFHGLLWPEADEVGERSMLSSKYLKRRSDLSDFVPWASQAFHLSLLNHGHLVNKISGFLCLAEAVGLAALVFPTICKALLELLRVPQGSMALLFAPAAIGQVCLRCYCGFSW